MRHMYLKQSIFVSIASYRDAELIPTLHDMIAMSSGLYTINIVICWQDNNDINHFLDNGMTLVEENKHENHNLYILDYLNTQISVLSIHYFLSEGACWARKNCEQLYQGEDYFLQIDSHCRFIKDWDEKMVTLHTQLKEKCESPVLSTYPPGYQPGKESAKETFTSRLVYRNFSSEGILQLSSVGFESSAPIRGSYLAGGFIFSEGSFVIDVPNDPQIFFEGEEISMAARAFTHGYDIWHPHEILLWHFYGRDDHPKIWSDHSDDAKKVGSVDKVWWDRDRKSKEKIKILLKNDEAESDSNALYSLGEKRSLGEYEKIAGVDFRRCCVRPEVVSKERCSYFDDDKEDWRKDLINANKKLITVPKDKISDVFEKISKLHIGVYCNSNNLLERKVLQKEEIKKALNEKNKEEIKIKLNFITSPELKPSVVRISPYLSDQGWGEIMEIAW